MSKLEDSPPEFIDAVRRRAEEDAGRVAAYLKTRGIASDAASTLSRSVLFGLGLILRLEDWESNGIVAHRTAGIPSSDELRSLLTSQLSSPSFGTRVNELWGRVLDVQRKSIVWSRGTDAISGDVAILSGTDEDSFLDELADFLWAQAADN